MSEKNCLFITATLICLLFFPIGCGPSAKQSTCVSTTPEPDKVVVVKPEPVKPIEPVKPTEPKKPVVKLALKFKANDVSTYNVITETQKSVLWEGPVSSKPKAFKGGMTSNRNEITFTQQIKSVDAAGTATAQITIKKVKYLAKNRDSVALDFDSSREKDKGDAMNGLIGQSYSIKLTSAGQVAAVTDTKNVLAAVKGNSVSAKTARSLLGKEVIKHRHSLPALPATAKSSVSKGDSWSALKSFDFGMLGGKTYERVYKLSHIDATATGKVAVAKMNAVPSVKSSDGQQSPGGGFLSKLFDNTEKYTGQLKMNLTTGKVRRYREELKSEWLAIDPEASKKPDEEPSALRMKALRLYEIEKID